jgi:hypothetical protein
MGEGKGRREGNGRNERERRKRTAEVERVEKEDIEGVEWPPRCVSASPSLYFLSSTFYFYMNSVSLTSFPSLSPFPFIFSFSLETSHISNSLPCPTFSPSTTIIPLHIHRN